MKSNLKCSATSRSASHLGIGPVPGPSSSTCPKCKHRVSFRDKREDEVHTADDWDRTPYDVVQKLSYDDVLELKEMQVAAAKACARSAAARGMPSKYLSNVPLTLLPLLPETSTTSPASPSSQPISSPPGSPPTLVSGNGRSSTLGLPLAEACLCRVFSADTGLSSASAYGQKQTHLQDRDSSASSSGTSSPQPNTWTPQVRLNGTHQIPSPPNTPPRLSVTSVPPPPPTIKARNFAFLPLLDASSSPASSPSLSPNVSGVSSPLSPRVGSPSSSVSPASLSASLSMLRQSTSSSSSSSASSPVPSPGAYTSYDPYGGMPGVRRKATLGLERKLGCKFIEDSDSDSRSVSSEEGDEDKDWPHDWPGKHPHHYHAHHRHHSSHLSHQHTDVKERIVGNGKERELDKGQHSRSLSLPSLMSPPKLPPSPPAESRPLPGISNSSPRGSPRVASRPSSLSPPPSRSPLSLSPKSQSPLKSPSSPSPSSPGRARKSKIAFPLVTLA